ncbi:MAG: hypothetical protein DMG39_16360 [Acidobacteria bacterium]|nr:MAG: hypothetical protein DMG39_16360 [Acidobacteriota bacterium]
MKRHKRKQNSKEPRANSFEEFPLDAVESPPGAEAPPEPPSQAQERSRKGNPKERWAKQQFAIHRIPLRECRVG